MKSITRQTSRSFFPHIFIVCGALICTLLLTAATHVHAASINGPEISTKNNVLSVSASVSLDEKYIQELRNGIQKNLYFYVDIFKRWNLWPDEFIAGRFIERTLQCDPVKGEYLATSHDGSVFIEKRFKSFESMLEWALSLGSLKMQRLRDLNAGKYYVRVTVESKIRKLPPVLGYFMIFLPENEFTIKKNSRSFSVEPRQ